MQITAKEHGASLLLGSLHIYEAFSMLSKFPLIFMEPQIPSPEYLSQTLTLLLEISVLPLALLLSVDNLPYCLSEIVEAVL